MSDEAMSDENYAAMREQVDAETARRAQAAAAERAAKLKPLTDLLASDAWKEVRAALPGATVAAAGEPYAEQVRALDVISGALAGQLGAVEAPIPAVTPA